MHPSPILDYAPHTPFSSSLLFFPLRTCPPCLAFFPLHVDYPSPPPILHPVCRCNKPLLLRSSVLLMTFPTGPHIRTCLGPPHCVSSCHRSHTLWQMQALHCATDSTSRRPHPQALSETPPSPPQCPIFALPPGLHGCGTSFKTNLLLMTSPLTIPPLIASQLYYYCSCFLC